VTTTGWDFDGELPSAEEERGTLHQQVQAGPEFALLRRRLRRFVFPMTALFLLWYLAYVLLVSYERDLMDTPVFGGINVGLVIGLAQFVSTFALTAGYVRYARRRLDPLAAQIRERVESGPVAVLETEDAR
jgi:uncharacterized membrane protein (DUF485 family)